MNFKKKIFFLKTLYILELFSGKHNDSASNDVMCPDNDSSVTREWAKVKLARRLEEADERREK